MKWICRKTEGLVQENGLRYRVYIDHDDLERIHWEAGSFDFGDEMADEQYRSRFKNGELFSYGVEKLEMCKCCRKWRVIDSLWAIHAASPEEAIKIYKEN